MPDMSGFQLCEKILELDPNLRVWFISAAELNIQALREVYPKLGFGCFIKKPVEMRYLVERLCRTRLIRVRRLLKMILNWPVNEISYLRFGDNKLLPLALSQSIFCW
jgi:response regulator RpfG family c-di-GMP phosphodiesterase